MKYFIATAFAALLFSSTLSIAEDQTSTDPTRHTMGDSGKLPANSAVTGRVPDMGAGTGTSTGTEGIRTLRDAASIAMTSPNSTDK